MQKKVPLRQCLGCRQMIAKNELLRVACYNGSVSIDYSGKASGRGAYVCNNAECLKKAIKSKAFDRAFNTSFPEDLVLSLQEQSGNNNGR